MPTIVNQTCRILSFVMILHMLTSLLIIGFASATDRYPGVVPSQFLRYRFHTHWSGNDTELLNKTVGSEIVDYDIWFNITVFNVLGENVTYQLVSYNETLTLSNSTFTLNIETGEQGGIIFAVGANLNVGDLVYLSPYYNYRIHETIISNYLGLQLETNHAYTQKSDTNIRWGDFVVNSTITEDWYWDRDTGVLLESTFLRHLNRSQGTGDVLVAEGSLHFLILSSVPIISEFPASFVVQLFMIAVLITAAAYRRKHSE